MWFSRRWLWRIPSSEMWRYVPVIRTNAPEECIGAIIRVIRIGELRTSTVTSNPSTLRRKFTNVVPRYSIVVTLMMEAARSTETSVLRTATGRHFPKYGILHLNASSHCQDYCIAIIFMQILEKCLGSVWKCVPVLILYLGWRESLGLY
jgi:hypothetical protein